MTVSYDENIELSVLASVAQRNENFSVIEDIVEDKVFWWRPFGYCWKAFINLITKAITAPFSLIGSLFNFSEDEINSVDFNLKESEITPIQKETLDKIALILNSKKEFAISFSPSFDEKNEKEKIANQRALNIQKYLIEEKSIDKKQVILEKEIKKTSSNIDLNLKEIKK